MNTSILTVIILTTAAFLGVLGWKLAWFLRKIAEAPDTDETTDGNEDRDKTPDERRRPES